MKVRRTPDSRFANLPDFPYDAKYLEVDGLRIHYVDEGPRDGEVVLMLHGEPSWSFLYRHMIPLFRDAGYRAIAPDLIGFGRSDKPARQSSFTYEKHVKWMTGFINGLGLEQINLVCQDWGSLIGLRIAAQHSDRFARIALGNGGLPTGDAKMPKAFRRWQRFARFSPVFPIGKIVQWGCRTKLSDKVIAAYNAPFPTGRYKAAARKFPSLVPTQKNDPAAAANREAWIRFSDWHKPFLTAFSDKDPITRGGERIWQEKVPGAKNINHVTISGAGHFLQEDAGPEFAHAIIKFMRATPMS